jgi:hypothetical protein
MGWGAVLAGIGGGIGGFLIGGPAGAVALGSQAYQAANAAGAEKKGAQQQQAAYQQAIDVYSPYNVRGNWAGNTLAGYLGMPEGMMPPVPGQGIAEPPMVGRQFSPDAEMVGRAVPRSTSAPPATLAEFMRAAERNLPANRPQTPSASRRHVSSYRTTEDT